MESVVVCDGGGVVDDVQERVRDKCRRPRFFPTTRTSSTCVLNDGASLCLWKFSPPSIDPQVHSSTWYNLQ